MEGYLGVARKEGITSAEINAVESIVMAVSAGRVMAQFREVRRKVAAGSSPPISRDREV